MGPHTDPGPSGSARVSKWSVRPCLVLNVTKYTHQYMLDVISRRKGRVY
ncbi:unnamed protein product, partial [Staurois parvus]